MYAKTRRCNIRWTEPLTKLLIEFAAKTEPTRKGYLRRLEGLWLEVHPTQRSRRPVLMQKLKRVFSQCLLPLGSAVE